MFFSTCTHSLKETNYFIEKLYETYVKKVQVEISNVVNQIYFLNVTGGYNLHEFLAIVK